ncbi:MAG TPA: dihydrolipoyl dehydrogenase [Burkholderiales bacterium]|nr:dihydrolipoyl dehydrogenase [Burkholderiales bacterium]
MSKTIEVKVPDIGDFKDIPVIEVLVKPGDTIGKEDTLVTLESDKATMDVPSPSGGTVRDLRIKVGDRVSQGTLLLTLDAEDGGGDAQAKAPAPAAEAPQQQAKAPAAAPSAPQQQQVPTSKPSAPIEGADIHAEVVVLGAGPGGYTAAFRAADLGKKTVLIERYPTLGGVCLNVGCIPSKALLHVAKVITEAEEASHAGISFGKPKIDVDKIRQWKAGVVGKLTKGLTGLAKQRKVQVVTGRGEFASANTIRVETPDGPKVVGFDHCIIAAGSSVAKIPGFPYDDHRIFDSTGALELPEIPKRLLVIGGGIIGLEMATVYDALGAKVSVVELMDSLIPGADKDIVNVLSKRISKRYEKIMLKTKVTRIESQKAGLKVMFEGDKAPEPQVYDYILMAVGRRPNGRDLKAEAAGVNVNERGYIPVDKQQRTNVPHIFAIGDVCGEPMLAHKATHEAKVAAEVIAGHKAFFDARTIPSVAYTDPEIAWMGLTETDAQKQGIEYEKAVFPWAASGRALSTGRDDGLTKLITDKNTHQVLGCAIVGVNAGELIAEAVLALEMGADVQDIALSVHPHPTLSETVAFAAEIAEGSITDLYMPKKS